MAWVTVDLIGVRIEEFFAVPNKVDLTEKEDLRGW